MKATLVSPFDRKLLCEGTVKKVVCGSVRGSCRSLHVVAHGSHVMNG